MEVLLQSLASAEARAIRSAAMLMDAGAVTITPCSFEDLPHLAGNLKGGSMPVGSVEFVREAMKLAGIQEPPSISYPPGSEAVLGRNVTTIPIECALAHHEPIFIKPVSTKAFTGFVYRPGVAFSKLDEHEQEQLETARSLDPDVLVYACNVVAFDGEWRYYVQDGQVIGYGRYDPDGPDETPDPPSSVVKHIVATLGIEHPHAVDIGVIKDGRYVLVEANDAWSIGLYGRALSPRAYLDFLRARWDGLRHLRCLLSSTPKADRPWA